MGLDEFLLALLPSAFSVIFDHQSRSGIFDRLGPRWRRFRESAIAQRLRQGVIVLLGLGFVYWWIAWLYHALDLSSFR
jgi:hypothetical protein